MRIPGLLRTPERAQRVRGVESLSRALRGESDAALASSYLQLRRPGGLPEAGRVDAAIALAAEAARRTIGLEARSGQILCALAAAEGEIAQMDTGEGKTLAAALALAAHACQRTTHGITANTYLSHRDAREMAPAYRLLGIEVSHLDARMSPSARAAAYRADVVYGTLSEFSFDHLGDAISNDLGERVQRGLGFALVDEADAVMIDEATAPLAITRRESTGSSATIALSRVVATLVEGEDYVVDRAGNTVVPTPEGIDKVEEALTASVYDGGGDLAGGLAAALRAEALLVRDVHYLVTDQRVRIIDGLTGRVQGSKTWAHGIQQAVEAKEGLILSPAARPLATMTVQGFLGAYEVLGGMAGTARQEREEIERVYGSGVVEVAPHQPRIRVDQPDLIYRDDRSRLRAVIAEVRRLRALGRPVLVGTPSVTVSESVSHALGWEGIPHNVVNARDVGREARVIAEAGRSRQVTVATNMAGRGVDIICSPEALEAGGLGVIGVGRHPARRQDDQLIGRAGRQGQPGSSIFLISAEDALVRDFGGQRISKLLSLRPGEPGSAIQSRPLAKAVRAAQEVAERGQSKARVRLHLFERALQRQQTSWFEERTRVLEHPRIEELISEWVESLPDRTSPHTDPLFPAIDLNPEVWRFLARRTVLDALDRAWQGHIESMAGLRETIGLRAYAQRQPIVEYSIEARRLFTQTRQLARQAALEATEAIKIRGSRQSSRGAAQTAQ
ncbi:hypothetical protein [Miltoncostaea oceani]|uniref:preprotein translocase subunit SecA n=1 Tax=Miltoncostaea oceani TaxID=2843216 RepID=UPI001C3E5EBE|nr:hypothetical protein [Miltoncostaea oceani]